MSFHRKLVAFVIFLVILTGVTWAEEKNIEVLAGKGSFGYKDGNLNEAEFRFPYGMAMDKEGKIYLTDSYNNLIRIIDGNRVSTLAGVCDSYDLYGFPIGGLVDGDFFKARFNKPKGIALDSKGDLFVIDSANHVIRKIANGKVYTFAGNGKPGYRDGRGTSAQFHYPEGIAIDGNDNIYVTDTFNHVIRKITPQGIVTTFAGKQSVNGNYGDGKLNEALFNEPSGIDINNNNELIIADSGNQLIRKIIDDEVITIAGKQENIIPDTYYYKGDHRDGDALEACFNFPKGIVAEKGIALIADTWNNKIRVLTSSGRVVSVPLKDSGEISLEGPVDMIYDGNGLIVSNMWNNRLIKINLDLDKLDKAIVFEPLSEKIQIYLDGKKINFPDVEPYIVDGKTMVPLRYICEELGARVEWLKDKNAVLIEKMDWNKIFNYDLDRVINNNGRTMIHVRYLAERMDFEVEWVPEYRAVVITTRE